MYSLLWLCTDGAAIREKPNHDDFLTISHIASVGAIPDMISTRFVDGLVIECGNGGKEVNGIIRSVRIQAPDIPLVLVEGGLSREAVTLAYLSGVDLVIPDDIDFQALLTQILHILPVMMKNRKQLDSTGETGNRGDLEFLRRSAMAFVDMGDDDNIYQYIAEQIRMLVPDAIVGVCSYDPVQRLLTLRTIVADEDDINLFRREALVNIIGKSFPVSRDPSAEVLFQKNTLQETPSLYKVLFETVPEKICRDIEAQLDIGKGYCMGFTCRGGIFGSIILKIKAGGDITKRRLLEAFVSQASVALLRRYARKLQKQSEERYRAVVESQTELIARFLPDGTHLFMNEPYCRYFNLDRSHTTGKKFRPIVFDKDRE